MYVFSSVLSSFPLPLSLIFLQLINEVAYRSSDRDKDVLGWRRRYEGSDQPHCLVLLHEYAPFLSLPCSSHLPLFPFSVYYHILYLFFLLFLNSNDKVGACGRVRRVATLAIPLVRCEGLRFVHLWRYSSLPLLLSLLLLSSLAFLIVVLFYFILIYFLILFSHAKSIFREKQQIPQRVLPHQHWYVMLSSLIIINHILNNRI